MYCCACKFKFAWRSCPAPPGPERSQSTAAAQFVIARRSLRLPPRQLFENGAAQSLATSRLFASCRPGHCTASGQVDLLPPRQTRSSRFWRCHRRPSHLDAQSSGIDRRARQASPNVATLRTTKTKILKMKTDEFITALRNSANKQLLFVNESGDAVHSGYHLTEVKAVNFDTVDCGGQVNHWHETILQLWVPADTDDEYMSVAKFLSIYDKVRRLIPLDHDAEIRVEYGDENFFPSTYHV